MEWKLSEREAEIADAIVDVMWMYTRVFEAGILDTVLYAQLSDNLGERLPMSEYLPCLYALALCGAIRPECGLIALKMDSDALGAARNRRWSSES